MSSIIQSPEKIKPILNRNSNIIKPVAIQQPRAMSSGNHAQQIDLTGPSTTDFKKIADLKEIGNQNYLKGTKNSDNRAKIAAQNGQTEKDVEGAVCFGQQAAPLPTPSTFITPQMTKSQE